MFIRVGAKIKALYSTCLPKVIRYFMRFVHTTEYMINRRGINFSNIDLMQKKKRSHVWRWLDFDGPGQELAGSMLPWQARNLQVSPENFTCCWTGETGVYLWLALNFVVLSLSGVNIIPCYWNIAIIGTVVLTYIA